MNEPAPRPAYDRIAHLYDVDMAQNMPFDDGGFYARACRAHGGRVLELGCGNGRVLLELIKGGIDVIGVDGSAGMLRELARKAAAQAVAPAVCQMDVRRLGFRPAFDVVLCPYSLVTYMTAAGDAAQMLREATNVLRSGGRVVVDAFVPRPVSGRSDFAQDYVRPFESGTLVRSKRITVLTPRINRIERRYDIRAADGTLADRIDTCEEIRVFAPGDVLALLVDCGLRAHETWWNYASPAPLAGAQFFTAIAAIA